MKYALLVYEKPGAFQELSEEEGANLSAQYWAIREIPGVLGGEHLQPIDVATTVRVRNGEALITDGPFADTKEVFGGFYLLEADTLDDALEVAARVPATWTGGSVEVRPVAHPVVEMDP